MVLWNRLRALQGIRVFGLCAVCWCMGGQAGLGLLLPHQPIQIHSLAWTYQVLYLS